ncbi:dihydrofolate reductase family protein [Brachybacterium huguangmaarense]
MRPIIVTEFLTLDGVMEAPGGGEHPHAGWTFRDIEFVPAAYALKGREQEEATALLLGRVTFEEFAPVWPSMDDQFARYNTMPKHVVSTTLAADEVEANPWGRCSLLGSIEDVAALKETEGGPIIVHGSVTLAQSLATAGPVDRYHLVTFPVLLGAGKRLFDEDGDRFARLRLVDDETFSNGVRASVYDVDREGASA